MKGTFIWGGVLCLLTLAGCSGPSTPSALTQVQQSEVEQPEIHGLPALSEPVSSLLEVQKPAPATPAAPRVTPKNPSLYKTATIQGDNPDQIIRSVNSIMARLPKTQAQTFSSAVRILLLASPTVQTFISNGAAGKNIPANKLLSYVTPLLKGKTPAQVVEQALKMQAQYRKKYGYSGGVN